MQSLMDIKRKHWSSFPSAFSKAMKSAFPHYKSPALIPEIKWVKCVVAYEAWYFIWYSDGLAYQNIIDGKKQRQYLREIIKKIANEPSEQEIRKLSPVDRIVKVIRNHYEQ